MGLALTGIGRSAPADATPRPACIVLWMNGGPSQLDTWDPKPGTRNGGEFKAIDTAVRGVRIAEHLPRLAASMEDLLLVRSVSSREGNHTRARYLLHTGNVQQPSVVHPSIGAMVARELGDPTDDLPPFVSIGGPSIGPGILGVSYTPLVVQDPQSPVENLTPRTPIADGRSRNRRALLEDLSDGFARSHPDPRVDGTISTTRRTWRFMDSARLAAFDLEQEPARLRDAYGRSDFGQGCLMARRLVESGVPFVEVSLDGWDTHDDNFSRTRTLCRDLDPAFATLIADLKERDMLTRTLIVCMGEFGRTPRISRRGGRDHFPDAFSVVLAGARIRTGQVLGATTADGSKVAGTAVEVGDLFATMARALDLDPATTYTSAQGRPIKLASGRPIPEALREG